MTQFDKNIEVEGNGCILCAIIFNKLVVYSPDGKMVDCVVPNPSDHRVMNERQTFVAYDIHPV